MTDVGVDVGRAGLMRGHLVAFLALLAAAATACEQPDPDPPRPEQAYSFLGIAVDVELGSDYAVGPRDTALTVGEPGGGTFHVGPATIELHDGTQLTLGPETPGGNWCEELYDVASFDLREGEGVDDWDEVHPSPEACVLIGEASPAGEVDWFQVLIDYDATTGTVMLGPVVGFADDDALVGNGGAAYRFPVAETLAVDHCRPDEQYRDLEQLVNERGGFHQTVVDVPAGEVVGVVCIYDQ